MRDRLRLVLDGPRRRGRSSLCTQLVSPAEAPDKIDA